MGRTNSIVIVVNKSNSPIGGFRTLVQLDMENNKFVRFAEISPAFLGRLEPNEALILYIHVHLLRD